MQRQNPNLLMDTLECEDSGPTSTVLAPPCLTIVWHPDVSRVGQRALLSELLDGETALLSRNDLLFGTPGGADGTPLGDPFLSRRPIHLKPQGHLMADGLRIDVQHTNTPLRIGANRIGKAVHVTGHDLITGVPLELAGRVLLLLHNGILPYRVASGGHCGDLGLVGESASIASIRREVRSMAANHAPVLLRGESGTGKELIARAIHDAGPGDPKARPFVVVNMAAINTGTACAELFGHARGGFTGADRSREGFFRRAAGGTLFLDEIGDAPHDVQVMLLRVIETGEIQRVGGSATERVQVRLVTATDVDLDEAVAEGRFRSSLVHRLAGFEIVVPPLRARFEDFGRLLLHLYDKERALLSGPGGLQSDTGERPLSTDLTARHVARLLSYHWPGNVRQLKNFARRLAVVRNTESHLGVTTLINHLVGGPAWDSAPARIPSAVKEAPLTPRELTDREVYEALRRNGFQIGRTAETLGISRTTLYALIDRSALVRSARDIPEAELRRCSEECGGDLDEMATRLEVSRRGIQLRMKQLGI
jgi:two-component system, NtrC family, nitrogen regulation response regulator GlnG